MINIITGSIILGAITYALFVGFAVVNWFRGVTGKAMLAASLATFIWLSTPLIPALGKLYLALEPIAIMMWLIFVARVIGLDLESFKDPSLRATCSTFLAGCLLCLGVATNEAIATVTGSGPNSAILFNLPLILTNVVGLVLVEQIVRHTVSTQRWRIRYFSIAMSLIFSFGLAHHALAVLFGQAWIVTATIQPAAFAIAVPLLVVASLRNKDSQLRFSLSRTFVFRTGVLVAIGLFLILLGIFGYFAQLFAGNAGAAIAALAVVVALALGAVLLGSSRIRSSTKVLLTRTLFEYRYDYRDEWRRVTEQLTEPHPDFDITQQAQRAIMTILHSNQAALWIVQNGKFLPISNVEANRWQVPLPGELGEAINKFYAQYDWVLDLNHTTQPAEAIAEQLHTVERFDNVCYLVPLTIEQELFGVCMLSESQINMRLSWEDYDLIKLVAKQSAAVLALENASTNLREQQQLSTINQLSSFFVHDIKTVIAQLSLMLDNAQIHAENPEFVSDMLNTTRNSVDRMQRIIQGLQDRSTSGEQTRRETTVSALISQMRDFVKASDAELVVIDETNVAANLRLDVDNVARALGHIVRNALDVTPDGQQVTVQANSRLDWIVISIKDHGPGMTDEFISNDLYTPFRSTKGLTGMGIGAYQAREIIRGSGGYVEVDSHLGEGTIFSVYLPEDQ